MKSAEIDKLRIGRAPPGMNGTVHQRGKWEPPREQCHQPYPRSVRTLQRAVSCVRVDMGCPVCGGVGQVHVWSVLLSDL